MKYFISSLGFWSKNVTSILNKNILLLNKKMYSIQLCTVNLWLYVFVMFMCIIYSCLLSTFHCMLSVCFVRLICTPCSYVLSTFDSMLYEGYCHDYIYSIPLCDVNLWLHFVFVGLSWAYVFYTAVCCQPLILCCMCVVACLYVFNTIVCCQPLYVCFC